MNPIIHYSKRFSNYFSRSDDIFPDMWNRLCRVRWCLNNQILNSPYLKKERNGNTLGDTEMFRGEEIVTHSHTKKPIDSSIVSPNSI